MWSVSSERVEAGWNQKCFVALFTYGIVVELNYLHDLWLSRHLDEVFLNYDKAFVQTVENKQRLL